MELVRCSWSGSDPLYQQYHDEEWGVPAHDDRHLFEMLCLEGAQAGLSWITILRKRAAYRVAFDQFDPKLVANYDQTKVAELLQDASIVRNRLKIEAFIRNGQAFLQTQAEFGTFDAYLWRFVDGSPIVSRWQTWREVPAYTPLAQKLSKDLKQRGFTFVGPTICYSYMQAVGLVNDHLVSCFRHPD